MLPALGVVVLAVAPPTKQSALLEPTPSTWGQGRHNGHNGLTNAARRRTGLSDWQAEQKKPCDWKGWRPGHICSPEALCKSRWRYAKAGLFGGRSDLRGDRCLKAPSPTLLFVHVGKTCGGSINAALQANAKLIEKTYPGQPAHVQIHAHAVGLDVLKGCGERVVISMRDPIDRVVSAFNTLACKRDEVDDPEVCVRPAPAETLLRRTNGTKVPKSLLSCFATVTRFAEALDDDDDCGEMARRSLSIKPAMPHLKLLSGHVSLGGCAYLGGALEELRNKSVYLINTETCDADIQGLPQWLGLDAPFKPLVKEHVGEFPHHRDELSSQARSAAPNPNPSPNPTTTTNPNPNPNPDPDPDPDPNPNPNPNPNLNPNPNRGGRSSGVTWWRSMCSRTSCADSPTAVAGEGRPCTWKKPPAYSRRDRCHC